jgi:hypothetical protein
MTLYWTSVGLGASQDPALLEVQSCTLAIPPKTFHIAYRVKATLPLISWTGWSLSSSGTILFNINQTAPSQRSQINFVVNTIIASIGSG